MEPRRVIRLTALPESNQTGKISTDRNTTMTNDREDKKQLQHCIVRKREVIRLSRHERRKRCAISLDLSLILDILIKGSRLYYLGRNVIAF